MSVATQVEMRQNNFSVIWTELMRRALKAA